MTWKQVTALVLLVAVVALVGYDLVAEIVGGNASTISVVLLTGRPGLVFTFGVLVGHLFFPQRIK